MTNQFREADHPRAAAGQFTEKTQTDPGNTMLGDMPATDTTARPDMTAMLRRIEGVDNLDPDTATQLAAVTAAVVEQFRTVHDMADLVTKYDNWMEEHLNRTGNPGDETDRDTVMLWAFATRMHLRPTDRTMAERFGSHVAERYDQLEPWQQVKVAKDLDGIERCTERDYLDRAEIAIGADAVMSGYRQNQHYQVITDAMYAESNRRHQAAGHTPSCTGTTLYDRAHNKVTRENGYSPAPYQPCTCGHHTH